MEGTQPLKILTLDGGGLQAISTLLILDKILDTIAQRNDVPYEKPRPCDVFDTIAGIGAGGWLAILLGRFHMDITTCLSEWYKIIRCIMPRSKTEELRMRALQHCIFNSDRLVRQVECLTKEYGTGDYLYDKKSPRVRTRHVFVAALRVDNKDYNLFRAYLTSSAKMPAKLREGPKNPKVFKITRAFGVTGSSKYFSAPWKEHMSESGRTRFRDKFPKPHNITELALDEMWAIYGTDVPIRVIVNIGPGLPSQSDVHQIARRFSWGLKAPLDPLAYSKRPRSPLQDQANKKTRLENNRDASEPRRSKNLTVQFQETSPREPLPMSTEKTSLVRRTDTFGSIKERGVKQKLKRLETEIERDIKRKLNHVYEDGSSLYYRLAPNQAVEGTTQNDSSAPDATLDATLDYLDESPTVNSIDEIERRISNSSSEC